MQTDAAKSALDQVAEELTVTFSPPLFLERRGWVLDIMRRERVTQVVDVGCGEGDLIACLCNPAPWLSQPIPPSVHPSSATASMPGRLYMDHTSHPQSHSQKQDDSVEIDDFLHVAVLHGLDVSPSDLEDAVEAISTKDIESIPKWLARPRWEPLHAKIWKGSLQVYNAEFVDIECIVATEVIPRFLDMADRIEHLTEDILADFAPVLLGLYHPRMLLITTPSYTFNARFTPPDAPPGTRKGFQDPTGRTDRIFRHDDHKFEWTVNEFAQWCRTVADAWDYDVQISGVGRPEEDDPWGRDSELGYASQTAAFSRKDGDIYARRRAHRVQSLNLMASMPRREQHILLAEAQHSSHPLAGKPASETTIAAAIKDKMAQLRTGTLNIRELWFDEDISSLCGGWVEVLVAAAKHYNDLVLSQLPTQYGYIWEVSFPDFIPRSPSPLPQPPDIARLDEDSDDHESNGASARDIDSNIISDIDSPAFADDDSSLWLPDSVTSGWEEMSNGHWQQTDFGWSQESLVTAP